MTVKIVTGSVADLPSDVVKELGITVVPLCSLWVSLALRFTMTSSGAARPYRLLRCPYFWRLGE